MRNCLLATLLAMLPYTMAAAQFGANPQDIPAEQPPEVKQDEAAATGQPAGSAPNAIFAVIDVDGDGIITKTELRKAIRAIKTLDADSDGNITLAEVGATAGPAGPAGLGAAGPNPMQLIERMMVNDLNQDGMLSANELPEHMRRALQNADTDGNQLIDRTELAAAIRNSPQLFGAGPGAFPGGPGVVGPGRDGRGANPATGRFLQYDANSDGELSAEEMPERMRGMMRDADTDGNGSVNAAELQAALRQMGDRARAAGFDPGDPRSRGRAGERRGRETER